VQCGLTAPLTAYLPFGHLILQALTFIISFGFVSLLFAAIYKILPDRNIEWHDVMIGAVLGAADDRLILRYLLPAREPAVSLGRPRGTATGGSLADAIRCAQLYDHGCEGAQQRGRRDLTKSS
jgi:hypothetical protein